MPQPIGKKEIGQKLRKEIKKIKEGKRYKIFWSQSKVISFTFNVIGMAEVEKLVKNRIKMEVKTKSVSVLRKGE